MSQTSYNQINVSWVLTLLTHENGTRESREMAGLDSLLIETTHRDKAKASVEYPILSNIANILKSPENYLSMLRLTFDRPR